jgi:hypothetical protein
MPCILQIMKSSLNKKNIRCVNKRGLIDLSRVINYPKHIQYMIMEPMIKILIKIPVNLMVRIHFIKPMLFQVITINLQLHCLTKYQSSLLNVVLICIVVMLMHFMRAGKSVTMVNKALMS